MAKSTLSPFLGVYVNSAGQKIDMITGAVTTQTKFPKNMIPFRGEFYSADGTLHPIEEVLGGGGDPGDPATLANYVLKTTYNARMDLLDQADSDNSNTIQAIKDDYLTSADGTTIRNDIADAYLSKTDYATDNEALTTRLDAADAETASLKDDVIGINASIAAVRFDISGNDTDHHWTLKHDLDGVVFTQLIYVPTMELALATTIFTDSNTIDLDVDDPLGEGNDLILLVRKAGV